MCVLKKSGILLIKTYMGDLNEFNDWVTGMKKLVLIFGNGLTLDLMGKIDEKKKKNIDLSNLFSKGDCVIWPDGNKERGFLSYRYCPNLWNLGARPNMSVDEANDLIESIITCANQINNVDNSIVSHNVYLQAYYELITYLKHLFIQYNGEISDDELRAGSIEEWGWLKLLKRANASAEYEKIIIITYNYDIFLERILNLHGIQFSLYGMDTVSKKVVLLKPHGSISFAHNTCNDKSTFSIRNSKDMYEASLSDFKVIYTNLSENYLVPALIPPSGESSRLTYKWAAEIREKINEEIEDISDDDKCVISGLSYWHVDRMEIDELLVKIGKKKVKTYMVNPHPPKALCAMLTCVLPEHIIYSSSKWIGDIIDE